MEAGRLVEGLRRHDGSKLGQKVVVVLGKAKRLADARGKLIEVIKLIDEITQDTEQ